MLGKRDPDRCFPRAAGWAEAAASATPVGGERAAPRRSQEPPGAVSAGQPEAALQARDVFVCLFILLFFKLRPSFLLELLAGTPGVKTEFSEWPSCLRPGHG